METTKAKVVNGVDVESMEATISAINENPSVADFKFRASNNWVSGAHNVSTIKSFYGACQEDASRDKDLKITADKPAVLLGTNKGPNPTEAVLHALAIWLRR